MYIIYTYFFIFDVEKIFFVLSRQLQELMEFLTDAALAQNGTRCQSEKKRKQNGDFGKTSHIERGRRVKTHPMHPFVSNVERGNERPRVPLSAS